MSKQTWNQIPEAFVCDVCLEQFKLDERLAREVNWTPTRASNGFDYFEPDGDVCKSHKGASDESYSKAAREAAWDNLPDQEQEQ
jgi:hypothetical protein